ncbi:GNAT family N-acetyltransferase [Paenibacillus aceris]|uniref:Ribosomal protein S18 acetylase RimI-like enzyme n=1 Tax=Paenibacillus aceris TaxID=869555 RepID=A0ABS4I9Z3_9BACL|nr:GNAT family N-acetyltransferase [Paenibacillus aceris]MBP1967743.1 ribosomal protein S18 acetylase RimI-like enzyme [Paenibacillus aceris]NHW39082.1 GNAT family N-acetyltransferase [Paenibacillus aceris]
MSIKPLSLHTNEEILHLLALQIASYRVEADLIGFEDIPPLKDGIPSIREAEETFYGYYVHEENENKLVGAISYSTKGCVVTICRMMVHPNFFRRGIARALLEHILQEQEKCGAQLFVVSTGTANLPAVQLYQSFDFTTKRVFTVPPGVSLTTFERPAAIR